jgi:hypothetical protein
MRLFSALALFAVLLSSFAVAATSQLWTQYATATVLGDCSQKTLSIVNRTEFLPFYAKPADEANIARILALVADLSTTDAAAQTYLQCGDYALSSQNGTLYWRGAELALPVYLTPLDARLTGLESQASQSSFAQQALEQRVSLLEADVLKLRSDFETLQYTCLGMTVLILGLLVWRTFFSGKQGGNHVSKLLHRKRN